MSVWMPMLYIKSKEPQSLNKRLMNEFSLGTLPYPRNFVVTTRLRKPMKNLFMKIFMSLYHHQIYPLLVQQFNPS